MITYSHRVGQQLYDFKICVSSEKSILLNALLKELIYYLEKHILFIPKLFLFHYDSLFFFYLDFAVKLLAIQANNIFLPNFCIQLYTNIIINDLPYNRQIVNNKPVFIYRRNTRKARMVMHTLM